MNNATYFAYGLAAALGAYLYFRTTGLKDLQAKAPKYYESIGSPPLAGRDVSFVFRMIILPSVVPVGIRLRLRLCQLSFAAMISLIISMIIVFPARLH